MSHQMICPHCGHPNSLSVSMCVKCGNALHIIPDEVVEAAAQKPGKTVLVPQEENEMSVYLHNRRAYFGRGMRMYLYALETDTRIPCDFEQYVTLGRDQTEIEPHLDLTPHNAIQLGVSRRHARLIRSTATVMIEDLGTLNGTFVNGEKVVPGHPAVICDGDELRLGKMVLAVVYEREQK